MGLADIFRFGSAALLALTIAPGCLIEGYELPKSAYGRSWSSYPAQHPEVDEDDVEVLAPSLPQWPHEEAGVLEVTGDDDEDLDDLVRQLRRKAARRGCHALVLTGGASLPPDPNDRPWITIHWERRISKNVTMGMHSDHTPRPRRRERGVCLVRR